MKVASVMATWYQALFASCSFHGTGSRPMDEKLSYYVRRTLLVVAKAWDISRTPVLPGEKSVLEDDPIVVDDRKIWAIPTERLATQGKWAMASDKPIHMTG